MGHDGGHREVQCVSEKLESILVTKINCLLCNSERLINLNTRSVKTLVDDYRARYGVDVGRFFPKEQLNTYLCAECGLRRHAPAEPGDGNFYDQMQMHPFYYETDKPEFYYAIEMIRQCKPRSILEIGCGEGHLLRKLAPVYDVAAIEYSPKSIEKLKASGIALDSGDKRYDFVMCFQVLEHVPNVRDFLRNAVNKLNNNGYLLITVPNNESAYFQEGASSILDWPPHHLTQWTRKALESIASQFALGVREYYVEPLRVEHLLGLLSARRAKLPGAGRIVTLVNKIGRLMDRIVAPWLIDHAKSTGHTHGMLFHKNND